MSKEAIRYFENMRKQGGNAQKIRVIDEALECIRMVDKQFGFDQEGEKDDD